ncbi:hypothetical protein GF420_00225 [candidate division GN15 bacterium]|nr:hypothetical protein [candidate division GN15 bacterium]
MGRLSGGCMRLFYWGVLVVVLIGLAAPLAAETEFSFDGQVRVRGEADKKTLDPDSEWFAFVDMRTRLGVLAAINDNTSAYIQLQDSRRMGGRDGDGQLTSGTLNNGDNVDVHQAFLRVNHLWNEGPGMRAGRFEVNLGNQRVFGSVGWSNVGRAWEGVEAWHAFDRFTVRALYLWLLEAGASNRDFYLGGFNVELPRLGAEVFTVYERDARPSEHPLAQQHFTRLDRISSGVYVHRTYDAFDLTLNGVYQFGSTHNMYAMDIPELDISAFLITAEAGYSIESAATPRVAIGIDYASGDDDLDDDTFSAYNNLYYTGHKFRGYMDYFIGSDPRGLMDVMVRGSLNPVDGWMIKADLHYFQTAAEYPVSIDETSKDVGTELDVTVSTSRVSGLDIAAGCSAFFPADSYSGYDDPDTGLWGYLMMTANF